MGFQGELEPATDGGAELDLMVQVGDELVGIEVKRTDQPRLTPSMRRATDALSLGRLLVLLAGDQRFPLAERVEAVPAAQALTEGLGSR